MEKENLEEEKLSDEEIIDILQTRLIKGDTVNSLCEDLNIDEFALLGYVRKLKEKNINVAIKVASKRYLTFQFAIQT